MRVLMVDDDPYVGAALARLLRRTAIELTFVPNVEAAFHALETEGFEAVVADYQIGDSVTGLAFLELVTARFPEMPCVLMSGVIGSWQEGRFPVLEKPFAP